MVITRDPYRNIETTLKDFAIAEGVPKYTVSHYYWLHRTLEHFRERPAKGTGNGIKPHTYKHKGKFISIDEARRFTGVTVLTLTKYAKQGITEVEDIKADYQRKQQERRRVILSDLGMVTVPEYARMMKVTQGTVYSYLRRHKDLRGFANRGHSRVNPKLYRHDGMGVAKSMKEWAKFFGCSLGYVKQWAYRHGQKMDGFENRKRGKGRRPVVIEHKGKTATLKEWADMLNTPLEQVSGYYYRHHKTLDGIETRKRGRYRRDLMTDNSRE